MTHNRDDLPDGGEPADELDRLRLALLHERSRAEHAERELAALRADVERSSSVDEPATRPRARRLRRRR